MLNVRITRLINLLGEKIGSGWTRNTICEIGRVRVQVSPFKLDIIYA